MSTRRPHVCLISEGSYPYVIGGTAEWTQRLVETLPDIDFTIAAISATQRAAADRRYALPPNVRGVIDIALDDDRMVRGAVERPPTGRHGRELWATMGRAYRAIMRNEFEAFTDVYRSARQLDARTLFQSRQHWDLVEHYYQMLTPIEPFIDFYWTWRFTHLMLYRLMRHELPAADVYHPIASGYAGFAGVCGKARHGGRLVVTEHGLYTRERELEISVSSWFRGYQKDFLTGLFDKVNRLVYASSDLIVSLYEDARQSQIKLGAPAARTVVIPNGVDLERLRNIPRRADSDDEIRIGLVGRVVPVKDVRAFIESAKVVAETVPNAEFHVIGPLDEDADYAASCRALVQELQLGDRVQFTGYQQPDAYLRDLDIVVLTSLKESQPLAALEAMGCGIPVVATRTGSLTEMLQEVGLLVWPRDVQGFADAMIRLARDRDLRRALGVAGQERVTAHYDQRQNLEQYRAWYQQLAEGALTHLPASAAATEERA
jgi:glycosyltransferase involved in cell wall biosynthesis